MKIKFCLCLLLICSLLAVLCSCNTDDTTGQTLYLELDAQVKTLDPLLASNDSERLISQHLYEGLVRVGETGEILPGAAQSYDISEDQTIYTFTLRTDAKWSDDQPLTAQDFVYGLQRAVDPVTQSPYASTLLPIRNASAIQNGTATPDTLAVTAVDATTLRIELSEPSRDFLRGLASPAAMPCRQDFFEQSGGRYGMTADTVISNGPFRLRRWTTQPLISIVQNHQYAGDRAVSPEAVVFELDQTMDERTARLADGQIDIGIISGDLMAKASDAGLATYTDFNTTWAILINPQNNVMQDSAIRTALAGTVRREEFTDLPAYLSSTNALLPPSVTAGDLEYRTAAGTDGLDVTMDPSAAQAAYTSAIQRIAVNQRGKNDPSAVPEFILLCPENEQMKTLASYVIQQWQKTLGAYVTLETLPLSQLESRVASGDFLMALYPFSSPDNSAYTLLSEFSSHSSGSLPKISGEFETQLSAAQTAMDSTSITSALFSAEQYLIRQGIVVPLVSEASCYAASTAVTGFRFSFSNRTIDLCALGKT